MLTLMLSKRNSTRYVTAHANMTEQSTGWEKELRSIRGIGDLDELNVRIERAKQEHSRLERQRSVALTAMTDALKSEEYSLAIHGRKPESRSRYSRRTC